MSAPTGPEIPDTAPLEGARVFSSWADLATAVPAGNPGQILTSAAGVGLDTLGFIADPFGELLSAGVGWLIEHIWFLREPFDALAGRPAEIVALSKSWEAVSTQLTPVAAERRGVSASGAVGNGTGAALPGWEGAAGRAFQVAAEAHAAAIDTVAVNAGQLATVLVNTGAAIGTVRALVRDWIAELVSHAITLLLAGAVAAAISGGTSLAAAVGKIVIDAVSLGYRIADRISDLITRLIDAGGTAGRIASAMRTTGGEIATRAFIANQLAKPQVEYLDSIGAPQVVETSKQFANAHEV